MQEWESVSAQVWSRKKSTMLETISKGTVSRTGSGMSLYKYIILHYLTLYNLYYINIMYK